MIRYVPFRLALILLVAAACGGSDSSVTAQSTGTGSTQGASGFFITISNMSFSPLDLRVPPGATVTVVNKDGMDHSVTSEATVGSYTPGAPSGVTPFDTGAFASGQRTFTIPASVAAGTVIPYYCSVHRQAMNTPNGTITIDPSAQPTTTSAPSTTTSTPTTTMPMPTPTPAPGSGGY